MTRHIKAWCKNADLLVCGLVRTGVKFILFTVWSYCLPTRMIDRTFSFSGSLICQVVDTPYLVNPEWKNFIPGYMYNDSDLELTAETFYRQGKLIFFYVFRWLCFVWHLSEAMLWWWFFVSQPISHLSHLHFVFTFGYKPEWVLQQDKAFIQL